MSVNKELNPEISWFTPPVGAAVGYGYAAVALIRAIQDKGVKVVFNSYDPLVHVSFVQPQMYEGQKGQYRIGYTPWESTEIEAAWVEQIQSRDEFWTTSHFCHDVFANYGLESTVVPHGINPEDFPIFDRSIGNHFNFLHIGEPTQRKGGQRVVDAFVELFEGNDDIRLFMKSNGSASARWRDKNDNYHGNVSLHPQITVYSDRFDAFQMKHLYHQAHCLVYPTNGEGFGLIPFQGIATGLPTICTNATACADFAEMSMPLKWTETQGYGIHLGNWAEPDFDHLKELMLDAVENWEENKQKAVRSARIIHGNQTWSHMADLVLDILGDKIYEKA